MHTFSSRNLHYVYNKEYYSHITNPQDGSPRDEEEIAAVNDHFFSVGAVVEDRIFGNQVFYLQVRYPGLLIGTGRLHESGILGELKTGLSLDYTTGLPYIPGSEIKGIVRNAFSNTEYIKAILEETKIQRDLDLTQVIDEIFEGVAICQGQPTDLPLPQRDVFFDAYPSTKTRKSNPDALYYLLDAEALTPHSENLLYVPSHLNMAKVKPGVIFAFPFTLHDGLLTAAEKCRLFKRILKDFGVGARTNQGFGVLADPEYQYLCTPGTLSPPAPLPLGIDEPDISKVLRATVTGYQDKKIILCLPNGQTDKIHKSQLIPYCEPEAFETQYPVGSELSVRYVDNKPYGYQLTMRGVKQ